MTSVYKKTLRTILYLCKFIGIINISYVLQSDGLLIQSTELIYKCLDISRIILLIIFTHCLYKKIDFIHSIQLLKLWSVIIVSRISETQLIK
jgi:hypothetical protein